MLQLPEEMRDEITRVLQGVTVPAAVGATLIQIATILSNLKEVEKEDVKKTKKDA